jgi:hypothetical protein
MKSQLEKATTAALTVVAVPKVEDWTSKLVALAPPSTVNVPSTVTVAPEVKVKVSVATWLEGCRLRSWQVNVPLTVWAEPAKLIS